MIIETTTELVGAQTQFLPRPGAASFKRLLDSDLLQCQRCINRVHDHAVDSDREPCLEHLQRSTLWPKTLVRAPHLQPMLEKQVEVLVDKGLSLLDGIQIGTEKDRWTFALLRLAEAGPVSVERIRPVDVGLFGREQDRATIKEHACIQKSVSLSNGSRLSCGALKKDQVP